MNISHTVLLENFVSMSPLTHTFSVRITAATGRVGAHGLHVVLILLIVSWQFQVEVVTMVRWWRHRQGNICRLPWILRGQHILGGRRRQNECTFVLTITNKIKLIQEADQQEGNVTEVLESKSVSACDKNSLQNEHSMQ